MATRGLAICLGVALARLAIGLVVALARTVPALWPGPGPWRIAVSVVVAGIVVGIVALGVGWQLGTFKAVPCPQCGQRMPPFRKPRGLHQLLWGGWTCPNCRCRVDRRGKAIEPELSQRHPG